MPIHVISDARLPSLTELRRRLQSAAGDTAADANLAEVNDQLVRLPALPAPELPRMPMSMPAPSLQQQQLPRVPNLWRGDTWSYRHPITASICTGVLFWTLLQYDRRSRAGEGVDITIATLTQAVLLASASGAVSWAMRSSIRQAEALQPNPAPAANIPTSLWTRASSVWNNVALANPAMLLLLISRWQTPMPVAATPGSAWQAITQAITLSEPSQHALTLRSMFLVPLLQELVFRGPAFWATRHGVSRDVAATLSSVAYGAAHLGGHGTDTWHAALHAAFAGEALCEIADNGGLHAAVLTHVLQRAIPLCYMTACAWIYSYAQRLFFGATQAAS